MSLRVPLERPEGMTDAQWVAFLKRAVKTMKTNTPVRTGRLRDGWTLRDLGVGAELVNEVPYGIYVDQGNTRGLAPRNFVASTLADLG